jgi:MSHA biogenesis protein MshI
MQYFFTNRIADMGLLGKAMAANDWLAIEVAADGLYALRLSRAQAHMPVVDAAIFQAVEPLAMADMLAKICKQLRCARHRCTTLLSHGQYQLISMDAPDVPANELKEAVRWRLKDMLDFPADQATIDLVEVPTYGTEPARKRTILAVAASNDVIERRQRLFSTAGVALSVIDIPEMAQRNIAALLEPQRRGLAMLAFHDHGALLTVSHGGELYLSRRIDVSPAQLMAQDGQIDCFERITLELQRSLDYCDRQYHFIVISKLLLAPIDVPQLQVHLAANLDIPVEMLDLATVFDLSRVPDVLRAQQRFFWCLGAALRQQGSAR